MTPLELAAGAVLGFEPEYDKPPSEGPPRGPMAALEEILHDALVGSPCLIEFSGGRDSSAVLAVASHVARREGLPLPIPITRLFPEAPDASEGDWPEVVIRHLGLEEWVKVQVRDELDLLGPLGTEGLRRHGVLWPITVHTKVLTFEYGRGGTMVSGEGGDEVFGHRRITPLTKMLAGARPRLRGVKPVLASISPRAIRRLAIERALNQQMLLYRWLRPAARRLFMESVLADALDEPVAWSASIRTLPRRRGWKIGKHNMSLIAEGQGVHYVHPLLDERFVEAFAMTNRRLGYPSRTHAVQALFGHLLPPDLLTRRDKASFIGPHVHDHSRAFIERWTGSGVDPDLVDPDELKKVWTEPAPHAGSLLLLQQAKLKEMTP